MQIEVIREKNTECIKPEIKLGSNKVSPWNLKAIENNIIFLNVLKRDDRNILLTLKSL